MNLIPEIELQTPERIKCFQEEKLRTLLSYVEEHSVFYQRHFREHNVKIEAIHFLEDLRLIPPTTKDDLQHYNWDFLCVPRTKIREFTSTSGTLGKPVTIALTAKDLRRLAYNECISFACAGGTPEDLYQLMLTLDRQFMAGIAYYEGIRELGAGMVRVGPGVPAMQWDTIERLKPTVLVGVPSFLLKLMEYARHNNISLDNLSVQRAICIGENIRTASLALNTIGTKIREHCDIQLYGTYASTEMQTAFTECEHGVGGHHHPELLIVELLDGEDNPVPPGTTGEVAITTLGVEGMPLIRYKTGDMTKAHHEKCACGRTTLRLGPIEGRKQQMIKLKGTTLYPPGVFEILNGMEVIKDYVVEAFTGELGTDELKLHLLVKDNLQTETAQQIATVFQSRLRVVPEVSFTSAQVLEKLQFGAMDRKIRKFIDTRNSAMR